MPSAGDVSLSGAGASGRISDVVALIQELTGRAIECDSTADLFSTAFKTLFPSVNFDVAVAVLVEQNLALYIFTREGMQPLVTEELITRVRETLHLLLPVSFANTDVVVKFEQNDFPAGDHSKPLAYDLHSLLHSDQRVAGLLQVFAGTSFSSDQEHLFEIFTTQVSLLLGYQMAREEVLRLADTDDLTGIWNKRTFVKRLPQEVERARAYREPLSLLMFDVDDFKHINDSFGHTIGDVVLSELCGAVRETLRPPDFFARFGGDEFSIILPHTDLEGARSVADRVVDVVRTLLIPTDEEGAISVSISMGVATLDHHSMDAEDLVRSADDRLYLSKRDGKNRYTAA